MHGQVWVGALVGGVVLVAGAAPDARACGGCFVRPTSQNGTVVTDHRMIFSVSPTQTTLYDQIRYSGSPSDFAWVLPIHGQVTLGVSSDLLFEELDQQTQTTILAPLMRCPPMVEQSGSGGGASSVGTASTARPAPPPPAITVIAEQVVGPYATVQLHPNSTTDTTAVTSWLDANGYAIPASVGPIIAAYVKEGFDFLAIKLVPGQGVQAMRPISVTSAGAGLSLPLRMVAAGTGSTVGITLWVVASGRYEPKNFPSFVVDPSTLVWDWRVSSSNYADVRAEMEQEFGQDFGRAWQIESSFELSPPTFEQSVLQADPSASAYDPALSLDGSADLAPVDVRTQDFKTLFPMGQSSTRVTRMRADLSWAALATDLVLQASCDQSILWNVYEVTESINCPAVCSCGSGTRGDSALDGGADAGSAKRSASGPSSCDGGSLPPSPRNSGCSTAPPDPPGAGLFAALVGLIGMVFVRARVRRISGDAAAEWRPQS